MWRYFWLNTVICGALGSIYASEPADNLKAEESKTLYALGLALSRSVFNFQLTDTELELVKQGLTDGVKKQARINASEYGPKVSRLAHQRMNKTYQEEEQIGSTFRAAAAKEPGAVKTPSGMIFKILQVGSGEVPGPSDTVIITVRAASADGTEAGQPDDKPVKVQLGSGLVCWDEGIHLMRVGGTSRLVCPPDLTYGRVNGPHGTKAGATLIFTVHLLEIVKPALSPVVR